MASLDKVTLIPNEVSLHKHLRDVAVVPIEYEALYQALVVLPVGTLKIALALVDGAPSRIHVDYQSVELFTHFQASCYEVQGQC